MSGLILVRFSVDPTQIFLQRLVMWSWRWEKQNRNSGAYNFKTRPGPLIFRSVSREIISSPASLFSPSCETSPKLSGVSVNLLLVWVCLREARRLFNFESPSEKRIVRALRAVNMTGRGIRLPSPFTVWKKKTDHSRYFIKGFPYRDYH